ncbi:MAG: tetratricopeptide repeat protein [Phycisphaerae bacterium]
MNLRALITSSAIVLLTAASGPAAPDGQPAEREPLDTELHELIETVSGTAQQLWRESIEAPPQVDGSRLSEMVGEIQLLRLDPEDALNRSRQTQEPVASSREPTTRPTAEERPGDGRREQVAEEVLAQLQASAPRDPARATQLADTLFADEHYEAAYALYEAVLEHETSEQRASWLVFQMANCRKYSDPETARQLYLQLIEQYPNSRWVEAARVQEKIIHWQQVNEPRAVLRQARGNTRRDTD